MPKITHLRLRDITLSTSNFIIRKEVTIRHQQLTISPTIVVIIVQNRQDKEWADHLHLVVGHRPEQSIK